MQKVDNQNVGNAGEYFFAHILSANGFTATITLGRAEKFDIMAVSPNGKTIKIQVKTLFGSGVQWRMGEKDGSRSEKDLFYTFVRLNDLESQPDYWIFPSEVVSKYISEVHPKWLNTLGKDGQKHNDGPWRSFRIKSDKYTPSNWTEFCKKHEKNISLLK
jgi:hypothetical protein